MKKVHALTSWIGLFSLASSAMAQTAPAPTAPAPTAPAPMSLASAEVAQPSPFHMDLSTSVNSTLHQPDNVNRSTYAELMLSPSYVLSERWSVSARWSIDQELIHDRLVIPNDVSTSLKYKFAYKTDYLGFSTSLATNLPTSKKSRRQDSLIVGLGVGSRITYDLSPAGVPLQGFYTLGIGRNIHEYTVSTTGKSNTEYTIKNRFLAEVILFERLEISTDVALSNNWTYFGNMTSDFSIGEEIGYKLTPALAIAAGIGNDGNMLKANGYDSNFAVFNGETSTAYVSVSYTF